MAAPCAAEIPVIDLAGNEADVARQLVAAAEDHGFIYIRNLGRDVPPSAIDQAFSLSRKLFAAPLEEKQRCAIQTNNRGWGGPDAETLDPKGQTVGDFKEAQQPLPACVADDEASFAAFADVCRRLCLKILRLLGLGLDVGEFFSSAHFATQAGSGTILRFLQYPHAASAARPDPDVRAGAHSDYGSITLLFRLRGQAGLEVLRRDGAWAPVSVCPPGTEADPAPPVLVNIGDLLSYWTNGLFRSTVHRVVFSAGDAAAVAGESCAETRYSIAFFCHPDNACRLEPVPSRRVSDYRPAGEAPDTNPYAKRRVMTAEEHLFMRLRETYGSLYGNVESQAL
ncbi:hypothetical protein CDD83_9191 [Cordyceps sp. RAO-2017]|nr:hypothetical protein CDD83_9191 [Cordyceps sp. RAO-2017]